MLDGSFIVDGTTNFEMDTVLITKPNFQTPRRKNTSFEIPSKSGAIYFDQNAYENTPLDLEFYMMSDSYEEADMKRNKFIRLFDTDHYVSFINYTDPDKAYYLKLEEMSFVWSSETYFNYDISASFSVHPFKMKRNVGPLVSNSKKLQLINPYLYPSEPIITLEGIGDSTLTVNGKDFVIKNITGIIIIDTPAEHSYRYDGGQIINENGKVYTLDYPVLKPGINEINCTGNITKITVEPRWQTLI